MAFAESEQATSPPKRKKGLPFKRTAVRPPSASAPANSDQKPEDNDIDFFRRSKDVFSIVADEAEEKDTKGKLKSPENHERKRRKLSSDSEDGVSWKKRYVTRQMGRRRGAEPILGASTQTTSSQKRKRGRRKPNPSL
jgi:hypothetical protein